MVLLADTITPAISGSFLYLFILNAFIGILEGKLLRKWFGGGHRAVWWMIFANYLSAWAGWFLLIWIIDPRLHALLGPRPIERVNHLALGMVLIAFVASVLIEALFVHLATKPQGRSPGLTILASFCVNLVSYVIVCFMLILVSFSLPLNAKVVPLTSMGTISSGTLYWVDSTGRIMSRTMKQNEPDRNVGRAVLNDFAKPYQLHIDQSENPQRTQITVRYSFIQSGDRSTGQNQDIPPDEETVLTDAGPSKVFPADYWSHNDMLRKSVLDLRSAESRRTAVHYDWYRDYLDTSVPGGPHSRLYIALRAEDWPICNPTVLPDGKIVFDWCGQIVLFDPQTTKLAFIALGTCPAFVPSEN